MPAKGHPIASSHRILRRVSASRERTACSSSLFLAQRALRVEIADASALAAGRRVDHRIDEGWVTGVHRLVYGTLEFIGRRRIDADAAERLDHPVVARALDEHRRRRIRAGSV